MSGSSCSVRCCCCRCAGASCFLVSLLLLAGSLCVVPAFNFVFRRQLEQLMPLANGSMSYQGWAKVPNDLTFELWVWNVTNPEEVVAGGRPSLQQVGPFAFKESRRKEDIRFFANDSVAFREIQTFRFSERLSIGPMENFTVTSVNMPYAVTGSRLLHERAKQYVLTLASRYFAKYSGGLFVTRSAKEILLGYTDSALRNVEPIVRRMMPKVKFQSETGLFIGTNNTDKGVFLVHTGRGNLSRFNEVLRWKGEEQMDVWPSDWANRIVGTDGSMFPPQVTSARRLKIFSPDICRSLELEFKAKGDVLGIPSLRYGPRRELMLNASLNPSNAAFCTPNCLDSGILNISVCRGVPLAISAPHFTDAPTYAAAVDGLSPSPSLRTLIDVEPNTGFVILAARKMQMNLLLERVPNYGEMSQLPELTVLPLMWLNESGGITPEPARLFKQHLLAPIQTVAALRWWLLAAGLLLLTAVVACCCHFADACRQGQRRGGEVAEKRPPAPEPVDLRHSLHVDQEMLRKLLDSSVRESDIC